MPRSVSNISSTAGIDLDDLDAGEEEDAGDAEVDAALAAEVLGEPEPHAGGRDAIQAHARSI